MLFFYFFPQLFRYNWHTKKHTYLVYIIWCLDIRKHPWYQHHNQSNRHPTFPQVSLFPFLLFKNKSMLLMLLLTYALILLNQTWCSLSQWTLYKQAPSIIILLYCTELFITVHYVVEILQIALTDTTSWNYFIIL